MACCGVSCFSYLSATVANDWQTSDPYNMSSSGTSHWSETRTSKLNKGSFLVSVEEQWMDLGFLSIYISFFLFSIVSTKFIAFRQDLCL